MFTSYWPVTTLLLLPWAEFQIKHWTYMDLFSLHFVHTNERTILWLISKRNEESRPGFYYWKQSIIHQMNTAVDCVTVFVSRLGLVIKCTIRYLIFSVILYCKDASICHCNQFSLVWFMVFTATFINILDISWRLVLLVEKTGVPRVNHRPVTSHWQTLSHNVILSTPCYVRDSNS